MTTMATEQTIIDYLASKNIRTFKASGPEVTAWCFFCNRHQRDRGRLYINTSEGVFYCQVCQEAGSFARILEHFGDEPTAVRAVNNDVLARRRILNAAVAGAHEGLIDSDKVLGWLMGNDRSRRQRGLTIDTIEDMQLGFIGKGWKLTAAIKTPYDRDDLTGTGIVFTDTTETHKKGDDFFHGPQVIIPYLSSKNVVQVRGRDWNEKGEGKYYTGQGESIRLYCSDDLRDADEALIVEGEFDRAVLKQLLSTAPDDRLRKMAVVGLPGAGSFDKTWVEYFRNCKRVYVALDPDDAGRKGAIKVKEALGTRARIVELPEDLPKCDWTEYIVYRGHTWHDVQALLLASAAEDRRLYTFSEAHDSFLDRATNGLIVKTGFAEIDAAIDGGGIPGGAVCVLAAKTGAGKTLIAGNMLTNHVKDDMLMPTLFVSLEMHRSEMAERFVRQYRYWHPYATDQDIRAAFDSNMMICDVNRLNGRDLSALVEEFEEERGYYPKLIVVDHLNYFARGASGASQYERTTNAIMDIKAVAKEACAATVVPTQVNRIAKNGEPIEADNMRDSGAIEEVADYLITFWRPDDAHEAGEPTERTARIQASLAKNRRGPKGQRVALQMGLHSLVIVDAGGVIGFKAMDENKHYWKGGTYEQWRQQSASQPALITQPMLSAVGGA